MPEKERTKKSEVIADALDLIMEGKKNKKEKNRAIFCLSSRLINNAKDVENQEIIIKQLNKKVEDLK